MKCIHVCNLLQDASKIIWTDGWKDEYFDGYIMKQIQPILGYRISAVIVGIFCTIHPTFCIFDFHLKMLGKKTKMLETENKNPRASPRVEDISI